MWEIFRRKYEILSLQPLHWEGFLKKDTNSTNYKGKKNKFNYIKTKYFTIKGTTNATLKHHISYKYYPIYEQQRNHKQPNRKLVKVCEQEIHKWK